MNRFRIGGLVVLLIGAAALVGCKPTAGPTTAPEPTQPGIPLADAVTAERAKLSPQDRALVEAQEWCVISNEERLGGMGAPIKLDIKGQAVFICCKGCKNKAEREPEKTLAKLEELKTKAKAKPQ